ncbi:MAG: tRNA 4-thiouridine(8) synthase ThiI [Clostridia bacterium]|nr:tRNA 4-thiouridine(8) synthase ThiI [Clostridia bacterium]
MNKVIIVRYSEIHLKGKNRNFFEGLLKDNIKLAIKKYNAKVERIPGRYMVYDFEESNLQRIVSELAKVAGIFSYSVATEVNSNYDDIKDEAICQMIECSGTFKVDVNRGDKKFPLNSMELARALGGDILKKNKSLKVDVVNPETKLFVDVRENQKTYIFSKIIYGMGGMPVESSGRGLLLLSGGIDSPVAGYMMAKRGVKLYAVHFHSFPYTSELAREKVEDLARKLVPYNAGNLTVFMVNMAKYQEAIKASCNDSYTITLLRRGMFRIAEKLAGQYKLDMIITGENLGQVASQTIESMSVVENVLISDRPVLRPLVAFDKADIITLSKKIDTYDLSIKPYEDCCTVFLPDSPITKPRLDHVEEEENKFNYHDLLDEAFAQVEVVKF